ncbi:hypothetical protein D2T33_06860 [Sinirhodobacter populi]|uniref:Transposase DDE domain-containing protein n=1 Tax=Paenirhodobacter populi TaxID=2306993 RepID=A0A443IZ67_9RHOB|nr:hypothetical protein D2T33_06860 [Sinirhodobacter populi]
MNTRKRRGSLLIWLDQDMVWLARESGRKGRLPVFSGEEDQKTVRGTVFTTKAIQFGLMVTVLFRPPHGEQPPDRRQCAVRRWPWADGFPLPKASTTKAIDSRQSEDAENECRRDPVPSCRFFFRRGAPECGNHRMDRGAA